MGGREMEVMNPSSYGLKFQETTIKAIGRYLCSRACDYAGVEGMAHYTLDTKDLSDAWMIDEQWLEDRKFDIYNAAWHDPLFLRNIKPGEVGQTKTGLFAIDVVESFDEEAADQIYVHMETLIDIWVRFVVHHDAEDLEKFLKEYKEPWIASSKHVPTDRVRHDLVCTMMARKILIVASDNSDEDSAQATIDIYPLLERPWEKDLIDEFDPGKESVVARRMRSDVFLSKYLLMYEVRDYNKEKETGWLDIQLGTDLVMREFDGHLKEGEADCRYRDARENYIRAMKSFRLMGYTGTYEELLSILGFLQTPTAMVDIFNRADQETKRRKKTPILPRESGRYPWSKEETKELKRRIVSLDPVNHPVHYADACSLECIDVMQAMFDDEQFGGYLLCNAFKYLWRHKNKGGKEDLRKAKWYLDKFEEDYISYSGRLGVTYQRLRFLLNKIMSGGKP